MFQVSHNTEGCRERKEEEEDIGVPSTTPR